MDLRKLQNWMQDKLLRPEGSDKDPEIDSLIRSGKVLSAQQHLGIYQASYISRLLECMRKKFTVLHNTLGDELFNEFAGMYLRSYPSKSPSLMGLGDDFPEFLQNERPDKSEPEPWIDFMISMAQFEIDLYQVFDGQGSENEEKATEETPDGQLQLQKAFALGIYTFNVHHCYKELENGNSPDIINSGSIQIVFSRRNYKVFIIDLLPSQYLFLKTLQQTIDVDSTILQLRESADFEGNDLEELWPLWKKSWVKEGFFICKKP